MYAVIFRAKITGLDEEYDRVAKRMVVEVIRKYASKT